MFWRILIFAVIAIAILWSVRKIWRDWTRNFREVDDERRKRDLRERKRPDVITLKRNQDGVFRPPGDDDDRAA